MLDTAEGEIEVDRRFVKGSAVLYGCMFFFIGCTGRQSAETKSVEQIYAEKGRPVHVRTIKRGEYSVYLKYPADFRARTQSTAYAKISDVVRKIQVKVGDHVARDQVILTFSVDDNASYQQAKLSYENAQTTYNRMRMLYAAAGVSKQDFDNAQTQYELAREAFKSAGDMIEVNAPIDGYITQLNVQTSTNVKPGDPLFTVSNRDGFEAYFYVTADEIEDIRPGEKTLIEGRNETIEGRITEVSLNMDAERKAVLVKAFFAGKPKTLVSGMNVDIAVEVYRTGNAITADQKELVREGTGWTAYVVKNGTAEKRKLKLGREQGITYEITEGLEEGDVLVTDGAQDLSAGEKVNIIPALDNPEVTTEPDSAEVQE